MNDLLSHAPDDLISHLTDFPGIVDEETEIRLLDESTAMTLSARLQQIVPGAKTLGLIALDDTNTSDHHCYITKGPAAGMILHLGHDSEAELAFDSLAKFLKEIRRLVRDEEFIDEIVNSIDPDESRLASVALYIHEEFPELSPWELCIYVRLLDTSNTETLLRIANHPDLYVREATGNHLAKSPSPDALDIAEALASDDVGQVAAAGARAVQAITGM